MALMCVISGISSFICLLLGSHFVAEGGDILGKRYSASVIGGLVIAWLNTAPETVFLFRGLLEGYTDFASGAISGSAIVVSSVALACVIYFGSRIRSSQAITLRTDVRKQSVILLVSMLLPTSLAIFGFNDWIGLAGGISYAIFLLYSLRHLYPPFHHEKFLVALKSHEEISTGLNTSLDVESQLMTRTSSIASVASSTCDTSSDEEAHIDVNTAKGWRYLFAGGILFLLFSDPFIRAIMTFANAVDMSPSLLAFFLAPLASEAPEILQSIQLSRKGNTQNINIAFSNMVGGTIAKTTLLCGIFSVYGRYRGFVWHPNFTLSFLLVAIMAVGAGFVGSYWRKLRKKSALALCLMFVGIGVVQIFAQFDVTKLTQENRDFHNECWFW